MPNAEIGMRVSINLAGMNIGGVPCGEGAITPGTIIALNPGSPRPVTVRLDAAFNGVTDVEMEGNRVDPI